MQLKSLIVMSAILLAAIQTTNASNKKDATMSDDTSKVVNWNKPSKHDIVERAVSDGMTEPSKIVEFAKNYKVTMTVAEVDKIKEQLKKSR